MNDFLTYILKASGGIIVFVIPYYLLMRSDPNLKLKRIYLLSGILLSFLFPLAGLQRPATAVLISPSFFIDPGATGIMSKDPGFAVYGSNSELGFFSVAGLIYFTGMLLLVMRNLYFYYKWQRDIKGSSGEGNIRYLSSDSIYTVFTTIFLPQTLRYDDEIKPILIHENAHIRQHHYVDLILLEFALLLTWFNPFTWLISGMIRENHEHLADREVLKAGVNPAHYKAQLVNQALGVRIFSLGHQFNYSLTKKRFEMMKTQRSSMIGSLKLAFLLPFVLAALGFVSGNAQSGPVKGKVILSGTGEPADGASIVIENTTVGTVSDKKGDFILKTRDKKTTLVISYVGYESARIKAEPGQNLKINLSKRVVGLDPVDIQESYPRKEELKPEQDGEVYSIVEDMPLFPGGMVAFKSYLANELKYPEKLRKEKVEGTVYVQYTISKTGRVEDVKVTKSANKFFDEEALRIIENMPEWTPGSQRGKNVDVTFTTPIRFLPEKVEFPDK